MDGFSFGIGIGFILAYFLFRHIHESDRGKSWEYDDHCYYCKVYVNPSKCERVIKSLHSDCTYAICSKCNKENY